MFSVFEEDLAWNHLFNVLFIFSTQQTVLSIHYILVTRDILVNKTCTTLVICDDNRIPGSP